MNDTTAPPNARLPNDVVTDRCRAREVRDGRLGQNHHHPTLPATVHDTMWRRTDVPQYNENARKKYPVLSNGVPSGTAADGSHVAAYVGVMPLDAVPVLTGAAGGGGVLLPARSLVRANSPPVAATHNATHNSCTHDPTAATPNTDGASRSASQATVNAAAAKGMRRRTHV